MRWSDTNAQTSVHFAKDEIGMDTRRRSQQPSQ